ncbi:helix-turn-helix transcriptional regulator [Sporichthya brevicatena]|uniref:Helix-turn-helix transcriptional regulator n=2 Tax=Sporichthya brevicatena TaxID=171442 RepID=A0ABP3S7U6_9ACTN
MRGMTDAMTVGERVGWYRRRRGMTQEVLAGLVGRTVVWLGKIENGRTPLDRLSVIQELAEALDISIGDLIAEPSLLEWSPESGQSTVPALRAALMDYRQLMAFAPVGPPPALPALRDDVEAVLDAYQASRYGFVVAQLPRILGGARLADANPGAGEADQAAALLALVYQATAMILTKLGETDLAWMAADRGLTAARRSEDPVVVGSLFRSVSHALMSHGRHRDAVSLAMDAGVYLRNADQSTPEMLSIYGTLNLAGSMAAARDGDRSAAQEFLREASIAASRLGADANLVWTAFGPTNVSIHRVATAMELGDVQVAVDVGPRINTAALPTERQARHAIEVARAYSAWNRRDDALGVLLSAERLAPEQVRHHYLSRQLVLGWIKRERGRPSTQLVGLAQRLKVSA